MPYPIPKSVSISHWGWQKQLHHMSPVNVNGLLLLLCNGGVQFHSSCYYITEYVFHYVFQFQFHMRNMSASC